MFGDGALTFREFVMREPHPLAVIHDAVLEFLRGRDDAVLFGAQAVNAYVDEPRMTQDVDIMSTRAESLAEEIRRYLNERFHIAARVRNVREGLGYRVYQLRKPEAGGNRHLVDVRPVSALPISQRVDQVCVLTPPELAANKVVSMRSRAHKPKGMIDRADLFRLLLKFPELKAEDGPVREYLEAAIAEGADPRVLDAWRELVHEPITAESDEDEFDY